MPLSYVTHQTLHVLVASQGHSEDGHMVCKDLLGLTSPVSYHTTFSWFAFTELTQFSIHHPAPFGWNAYCLTCLIPLHPHVATFSRSLSWFLQRGHIPPLFTPLALRHFLIPLAIVVPSHLDFVIFFFFLAMPHHMWDLSSPTRSQACTPALESQCLSQCLNWTSGEVPVIFLISVSLVESNLRAVGTVPLLELTFSGY